MCVPCVWDPDPVFVPCVKRDGTAKAHLCVQGNTLQSGVDYDQVFSAALCYSSARALFSYALRNDCRVRSVDLVAACRVSSSMVR